MSYHIYTTRGIVLSSRPRREADRVYSILTRDLGLIYATALGVRKEQSKLRGALEPLALANVSLVKGKDHWRLTSADSLSKIEFTKALARPLSLLEQLVQGEAKNTELYDVVERAVLAYQVQDEMSEIRFVAQILFHLGYLEESDLTLEKRGLVEAINHGIQASQLTRN